MRTIPILAAGLVAAASAAQAETYSSVGIGSGMSENVTHEVAEGHVVMDVHAEYSGYEMETEGNPMSGMSGPCIGAMEVERGLAEGGGRCVFTDADGETLVVAWTVTGLREDGAVTGRWQPSGGSGKWPEATGGGSFVTITDVETDATTNTIDGEITLP